jgi:hypothetical protein
MRRLAIAVVRIGVVACLVATILDVPLPTPTHARRRVHLIDRSNSVRVGPADTLKPENADEIRAFDQRTKADEDTVLWASFGRDVAFESTAVDGSATDLEGALEAVLARNPTEIVLYTDGRADPGRALLLCQSRGVPLYLFPLGPASVRDARLVAVRAPSSLGPGARATIEATVEATFSATLHLRLDEELRLVPVVAGVPVTVAFPNRPAGRFTLKIDDLDDCPENNEASGEILVRSEKKRILVLSAGFPELPALDLKITPRFEHPQGYDAVAVDNVPLSLQEQREIAAYVRDLGGGLLLLGGPKSFARGGWKDTPLEELSPLRANPDQRVAVVFAIDCSGSMSLPGRLDVVLPAVRNAWTYFDREDSVAAMSFPNVKFVTDRDQVQRFIPGGGTNLAEAIEKARLYLEPILAGRKQIFLLTDGETHPDETPAMRRTQADLCRERDIGLAVLTTEKEIDVGDQYRVEDWKALGLKLQDLVRNVRENARENPGRIELREHPVSAGIAPFDIPWMNLTSPKPDSQLVATVGRPPHVTPALALRQVGLGRVAALPLLGAPTRLLEQCLDYVAGSSGRGISLWVEAPVVRARGQGPPRLEAAYVVVPSEESGSFQLTEILSGTWEGRLPRTGPGTVFIQCRGARAAVTVPCLEEYQHLGVDRKALERWGAESGGRVLRKFEELAGLPRPQGTVPRSGRVLFLSAALACFFLEMAFSTFWKA